MPDAPIESGILQLDVNTAGAWKRVLHLAPFERPQVEAAVLMLCATARGVVTWRLAVPTPGQNPEVLAYCAPQPGSRIYAWRAA